MALSKVSTNQIDTAATPTVAEATVTGDLTVDTNTLHVDAANNRVGVGTAAPTELLHLNANNPEFAMQAASDGGECAIYFKDDDGNKDGRITYRTDYSGQTDNYMQFFTNGSERMRIDHNGTVMVGKTASNFNTAGVELHYTNYVASIRDGNTPFFANRLTNDGSLFDFYQAGTIEGNITVSGTTVSYNGGHLSRWSQAADGNRIDGLVKGTVMTNLDQMAEWTKDGVTEDNEQLNCMAVSSVEGDANVAGVFVNWDDDDTDFTADMNIAMTGDMVIRIASGTTVARGDLLMSAGDGTAKPQGDDIVRSKTIAKVTSTTVSHTYDDGSYLVPCVLMAC